MDGLLSRTGDREMKPVFQTRFGAEGNCWAACLASYFEVSLEEVDHCAGNHADWHAQTQDWLAARGLYYVESSRDIATGQMGTTLPLDGAIAIAGCHTDRALPHVVIVRIFRTGDKTFDFEVIHDPYPGESSILNFNCLIYFCHLSR